MESVAINIHNMWIDKETDDNLSFPLKYDHYREYQEDWIAKNPGATFVFWNKRKVDELWQDPRLAKWRPLYLKLSKLIERCDLSRYALLYTYPGKNLYHDLDVLCNRSVIPLMHEREFAWTWEAHFHSNIPMDMGRRRLSNSILLSESGHWLWPLLLDHIASIYDPYASAYDNTGPVMLSAFVEKYKLKTEHPELFISPCLILPLDDRKRVIPECKSDALETCYTFTRWKEGTGWGVSDSVLYSIAKKWTEPEPGIAIVAFAALLLLLLIIQSRGG